MSTTDQAICLRASDYSETSQVLTLLARQSGLVRLLGKGTKRPKSKSGGGMDLFSEGRAVFAGAGRGGLGTLMEFVEEDNHAPLRRDLARLHTGLYMLEATGSLLAEADPHPEVFDLLHNALVRLAQAEASPPPVLAYFQWRLLRHAGLLGDLSACQGCGKEPPKAGVIFSSAAGGLLCRSCAAGAKDRLAVPHQTLAALEVMRQVQAGRRLPLSDAHAKALNAVLAYHLQYQLGRHLRTARHALGR
jgi:DNA repair protein RecO (recombination protein O)